MPGFGVQAENYVDNQRTNVVDLVPVEQIYDVLSVGKTNSTWPLWNTSIETVRNGLATTNGERLTVIGQARH